MKSSRYLNEFPAWLKWAEAHWTDVDGKTGYYGSGDPHIILAHSAVAGYLAACVMTASCPELVKKSHLTKEQLIERALKSFRYIFENHVNRKAKNSWGRHWGSPIVIERVANFIDILKPFMNKKDLSLWNDMLRNEADFLLGTEIETNRFSAKGETHAERNYWRGSVLFRAAREMPKNKNKKRWLEKSSDYFINSFSVPDDETSNTEIDGKALKEWFRGANAHPGCAFEHHGALSMDYCIIPQSFHVMMMTGVMKNKWETTEALFHHMGDLWNFIRRFITDDGRIICFGKQRPRYTIMYNYLMPCLLFHARFGNDREALKHADKLYGIIMKDHEHSGDGSFYSKRGERYKKMLGKEGGYKYYRLDADAIISLGLSHIITKLPHAKIKTGPSYGNPGPASEKEKSCVLKVDEASMIFKRTEHGSFAVYFQRLPCAEADPALALCIPAKNGHRAEWLSNLSTIFKPLLPQRALLGCKMMERNGGFYAAAHYYEGFFQKYEDSYGYAFDQKIVFVLMPDGKSFLRLEKTKALCEVKTFEISSLNFNLTNDIFDENPFVLHSSGGKKMIKGIGGKDETIRIKGNWVNISDEIGFISLDGKYSFALQTFSERQRAYKTLLSERLCYPLMKKAQVFKKGDTVLDSAVLMLCGASSEETEKSSRELKIIRKKNDDLAIIKFKNASVTVDFSGDVPTVS